MQTTFIAVQCFQCSTMQVKQQKKSSNKWSCVVCNEKNSVRRVFAQGFMAKNVRQFVQNFNMSRQLSDIKQLSCGEEEDKETFEMEKIYKSDYKKKKRTDWTEYVDYDQDYCCGKFDDEKLTKGGDDNGFEAMVVTEMPKMLSKKSKLKDHSAGMGDGKNLLKPVFRNRSNLKRQKNARSQEIHQTQDICCDEEQIELHPADRASKWNSFAEKIQDGKNNLAKREEPWLQQSTNTAGVLPSKWRDQTTQYECKNTVNGAETIRFSRRTAANGPVSKWSSFITEEDEDDNDLHIKGSGDSRDHITNQWCAGTMESLLNGKRVEDEIHIDFIKGPPPPM